MASKKAKSLNGATTPRIIFDGLDPVSEAVVRAIIEALGDGSPLTLHTGTTAVADALKDMKHPVALCASPCPGNNAVPPPAGPASAPKAPGKKAPKAPADKPKSPSRKKK